MMSDTVRRRGREMLVMAMVAAPYLALGAYLVMGPLAATWLDGVHHASGPGRGASYGWLFPEAVRQRFPLLTWLLGLRSHTVVVTCLVGAIAAPVVALCGQLRRGATRRSTGTDRY